MTTSQLLKRQENLKVRYHISQDEYLAMIEKQYGLCALCHEPFGVRKIVIDHNHKTGKIRGLLHARCNLFVGIVEIWSKKVKKYLLDNGTRM